MIYEKIDSIVGLHVESVETPNNCQECSLNLHLSYGTTLSIIAGGNDSVISTALGHEKSAKVVAGKEISSVDYDDELCSSIMHIAFTDGTELEIRSSGQGISWIEATIIH
jgi:hypothetical protein